MCGAAAGRGHGGGGGHGEVGSLSIGTRRQSLTIPISTPRHHHHSTPFQQTHSSPPWHQGLDRSDSGGGFTVAFPVTLLTAFRCSRVVAFMWHGESQLCPDCPVQKWPTEDEQVNYLCQSLYLQIV